MREIRCRMSDDEDADPFRHAGPYAGHRRLGSTNKSKTWMAGTSPAMTTLSHYQTADDDDLEKAFSF
jgi:hypothetical protein